MSVFSHSVMLDSATAWTVACQASLSVIFSGKNTGVGCYFFLQGIFPTPLLHLTHCKQILYGWVSGGTLCNDAVVKKKFNQLSELSTFSHISSQDIHRQKYYKAQIWFCFNQNPDFKIKVTWFYFQIILLNCFFFKLKVQSNC